MDTMRTTPRPVRTLAALAVGVLLTTSACGGDDSATDPVAADRSDSPTATASPSEPAPSDVPSEEPAAAGAVPVYYVGDTGVGPRLFREFRRVSGEPALGAAEGPLKSAVFWDNGAKLYGLGDETAVGSVSKDAIESMRTAYRAHGAERSNLAYGYVDAG